MFSAVFRLVDISKVEEELLIPVWRQIKVSMPTFMRLIFLFFLNMLCKPDFKLLSLSSTAKSMFTGGSFYRTFNFTLVY